MFLRANHREKDGKRHTYWSLVETVRTADGPRQRTLCHLGELNDSAQARWLKTIDVFNDSHIVPPTEHPFAKSAGHEVSNWSLFEASQFAAVPYNPAFIPELPLDKLRKREDLHGRTAGRRLQRPLSAAQWMAEQVSKARLA